MKTAYVNFTYSQFKRNGHWGNPELMAHVQDLRTCGRDNVEANSPEELKRIIEERGAKIVHFYASHMPQRSVETSTCDEKKLYSRWFNWKPRQPKRIERKTVTRVEDPEIEIIL